MCVVERITLLSEMACALLSPSGISIKLNSSGITSIIIPSQPLPAAATTRSETPSRPSAALTVSAGNTRRDKATNNWMVALLSSSSFFAPARRGEGPPFCFGGADGGVSCVPLVAPADADDDVDDVEDGKVSPLFGSDLGVVLGDGYFGAEVEVVVVVGGGL